MLPGDCELCGVNYHARRRRCPTCKKLVCWWCWVDDARCCVNDVPVPVDNRWTCRFCAALNSIVWPDCWRCRARKEA